MTTCAIYTRISSDKGKGTDDAGLAVERQETLVRKLLERKGWTAGKLYVDNDVSAAGKVKRPAYEQMLLDYQAGEFEAIAAYDLDRLWRVPSEFEALLELAEQQGLLLATVGGDADLATGNGRLYARIKVAVAKDELERRSQRQKAKNHQSRLAGQHYWRRRPLGNNMDGTLNEPEAEALRQAATMILGGGTAAAASRFLNEHGFISSLGSPWTAGKLKRLFLNPRLISMREHEGELIPGNWSPVLDEDTWRAVGQVLNDRSVPIVKDTEKGYTLSGVAICGVCSGRIYGTRRVERNGKTYWYYRCTDAHIGKQMELTDEYVRDATLLILAMPEAEESFSTKESTEELKALRIARAEQMHSWNEWLNEAADNGLRPSEYKRPREKHEQAIAELDAAILSHEKESVLGDALKLLPRLTGASDEYRAKLWEDIPLERRRRILSTVWTSIVLHKPEKRRFEKSSIELVPSQTTMKAQQKASERILTNAVEHAEKLGIQQM